MATKHRTAKLNKHTGRRTTRKRVTPKEQTAIDTFTNTLCTKLMDDIYEGPVREAVRNVVDREIAARLLMTVSDANRGYELLQKIGDTLGCPAGESVVQFAKAARTGLDRLAELKSFIERNRPDGDATTQYVEGFQECIKFVAAILRGEKYAG